MVKRHTLLISVFAAIAVIGGVLWWFGRDARMPEPQVTASPSPAVTAMTDVAAGIAGDATEQEKILTRGISKHILERVGAQQRESNHHSSEIGALKHETAGVKSDLEVTNKKLDGAIGEVRQIDGRVTTIEKRKHLTQDEVEAIVKQMMDEIVPKSTVPISQTVEELKSKLTELGGEIKRSEVSWTERFAPISSAHAALAPVPAQIEKLSIEHGAIKATLTTHDTKLNTQDATLGMVSGEVNTLKEGEVAQEDAMKKFNKTLASLATAVATMTAAPAISAPAPTPVPPVSQSSPWDDCDYDCRLNIAYKTCNRYDIVVAQPGKNEDADKLYFERMSHAEFMEQMKRICANKQVEAPAMVPPTAYAAPEPAPTAYEQGRGAQVTIDEGTSRRVGPQPVYASGYGGPIAQAPHGKGRLSADDLATLKRLGQKVHGPVPADATGYTAIHTGRGKPHMPEGCKAISVKKHGMLAIRWKCPPGTIQRMDSGY